MLGTSFLCAKYLILILNALFVLSGVLMTALGIFVKKFYYSYESFVDEQYLYAPDFLIALGAIIFVISIVGCCGIIKENSCMSLTFTTFLILIFFFEMGVGLAGYIMKEEANDYLHQRLPVTMAQYNTSADIRLAWDGIQTAFNCCGAKSGNDWIKLQMEIPESCYVHAQSKNATPILHEVGCIENFGNFVRKHSNYIEVAGLGVSMLQLVGIIFSCLLANGYRKGYEVV